MAYTSQINAVPGGYTANAYATVSEADTYLKRIYGADGWKNMDGVPDSEETKIKERCLMTAAAMIDRARPFSGMRFWYTDRNANQYPVQGQALEFPRYTHESRAVQASGGTSTTFIVGSTPTGSALWQLAGAGLIIVAGTNIGEHRRVSSYDDATSTLTVDTAFTAAIDTTSHAYLLWPLVDVKNAAIEQAWALYVANQSDANTGGLDISAIRAAGVQSISADGFSASFGGAAQDGGFAALCGPAQEHLAKYRVTEVRVGRA